MTSLPTSPPRRVSRSLKRPNRNEPADGAVYVTWFGAVPMLNVGPLTTVPTGTQVGSLSVNGSVYVTQSTIFG